MLQPISTKGLKQIYVENSKGGYVKIKENGWVVQLLKK